MCPCIYSCSCCRHVLGDRGLKRGQWGGSVLDSVIGTFLTQNAADALSSQAFMTLVARFPAPASKCHAAAHAPLTSPSLGSACSSDTMLLCNDSIIIPPGDQPSDMLEGSMQQTNPIGPAETAAAAKSNIGQEVYAARQALLTTHISMLPVSRRECEDKPTGDCKLTLAARQDAVDWAAVLAAPAADLADTIKCRGMHNNLAIRIQVTACLHAVKCGFSSTIDASSEEETTTTEEQILHGSHKHCSHLSPVTSTVPISCMSGHDVQSQTTHCGHRRCWPASRSMATRILCSFQNQKSQRQATDRVHCRWTSICHPLALALIRCDMIGQHSRLCACDPGLHSV